MHQVLKDAFATSSNVSEMHVYTSSAKAECTGANGINVYDSLGNVYFCM